MKVIISNEEEAKLKNNEIDSNYLLDQCCKVREFDEEHSFKITDQDCSDGSRHIVMNNDNDVCIGMYTSSASCEFETRFGLDLELLLFRKLRRVLGFERTY